MMNQKQVVELLEEYIYDLEADTTTLDRYIEYERGYEDAIRSVVSDLRARLEKIKSANQINTERPLQLSDISEIY